MNFPKKSKHDYLAIEKNGSVYELNEDWSLTGNGSISFRNKLEERAFSHGSDLIGDGKVSGRQIDVEFHSRFDTEEEFEQAVNEAYRVFGQTNYDLYTNRRNRVMHVAGIKSLTMDYDDGYKGRSGTITASLLLSDPFRYDTNETAIETTFSQLAQNEEILVNNMGSVDTPLTFTFIPDGTMANINVTHEESGNQMTITDALLTSPAILTVNSKDGTVWRDTNNSINSFSGQFLYAVPGINHFRISCDSGIVTVTFTNRWYL